MRKNIAAVTASFLLVAGQAAAANKTPAVRVGDRLGPHTDAGSEFSGVPLIAPLIGAAVLVTTIVVATDHDSESD